MNEFTTLLAAPGQVSGEVPLSAVQRFERAGGRVIAHLGNGAELLLDASVAFKSLAELPDWVALDMCNQVRRSAIAGVRSAAELGLFQVLLDTGEVRTASGCTAWALAEAWTANVRRALEGDPQTAGKLPAWPSEIPAPKPALMSDAYRRLFIDPLTKDGLTDYVAISNELRDLQALYLSRHRPGGCQTDTVIRHA
jgi:hypothetical protein